jgi:hypothetical protein
MYDLDYTIETEFKKRGGGECYLFKQKGGNEVRNRKRREKVLKILKVLKK